MPEQYKFKLYAVVSREALTAMNGNRGKLGAQCGHAFLHSYLNAMEVDPDAARHYVEDQRAYKIVLAVDTTAEVIELYNTYHEKRGTALIEDAGFTVFDKPTVTCVGIGPLLPDDCDDKLKSLKPLI